MRLSAPDSVERDRIATPGEFVRLLGCLEPAEALPFALAAYGTARAQEIRVLQWPKVDLDHRQMELADEEGARKSRAAHRVVPLVNPLLNPARGRVEGCGPSLGRARLSATPFLSLRPARARPVAEAGADGMA